MYIKTIAVIILSGTILFTANSPHYRLNKPFIIGIHTYKWYKDINKNKKIDHPEVKKLVSKSWEGISKKEYKIVVQWHLRSLNITDKSYVYKKTKQRDLKLYIDYPPKWKKTDKRPAFISFSGGGLRSGTPYRFKPQSLYFAGKGLVGIRPDYRVSTRDGVQADSCIEDARSSLRWIIENAEILGIDKNKIIISGGSSGGHLALACILSKEVNSPDDNTDTEISAAALVLWAPVVDTLTHFVPKGATKAEYINKYAPGYSTYMKEYFKNPDDEILYPLLSKKEMLKKAQKDKKKYDIPEKDLTSFTKTIDFIFRENQLDFNTVSNISPTHLITDNLPPALFIYGEKDFLFDGIKQFISTSSSKNNKNTEKIYKKCGHGFQNKPPYLQQTTKDIEEFLIPLSLVPSPDADVTLPDTPFYKLEAKLDK
jgi:acetyl esterase/lipase